MKQVPQYRALWRKIKETPDRAVIIYCPASLRSRVKKALRNERAMDKELQHRNFYQLEFTNDTGATFTATWKSLPAAACIAALHKHEPIYFNMNQDADHDNK